jgi:hypothetical protein
MESSGKDVTGAIVVFGGGSVLTFDFSEFTHGIDISGIDRPTILVLMAISPKIKWHERGCLDR